MLTVHSAVSKYGTYYTHGLDNALYTLRVRKKDSTLVHIFCILNTVKHVIVAAS